MNEINDTLHSSTQKKQKIRDRYKGVNPDELDVIPALPQQTLDDENRTQRVAVYARVSTDDPRQTSSYELQKNHYQDLVTRHPGWVLTDIYADEGISGTSLQHRDSFLRMIDDCKAGKIDLIITKSVSRFARNVLDCIGYVRQLAAMHPPVGVLFETENIYTLNSNSEMTLSFISTLAQEESHTKSEIMNASIEMRFKRGIFLTPALLGYDHDENGNLIINDEESKTVRLVYFMYLYGYSTQEIADQLTVLKRETKLGNTKWSAGSVLNILQNERYCGDVLARKTWTPNYLDHKSKKNNQDRNQYRQRDHHEAIVTRDDFIAVQKLITNAKYGHKGFLPQLTVVSSGLLRGFVLINLRWAGFKEDDYINASSTISDSPFSSSTTTVSVDNGDFDLRGFEIARGQFFDTTNKIMVRITSNKLSFSSECIQKFSTQYVELLFHPKERLLAIRPSTSNSKNAVRWAKDSNNRLTPNIVSGTAFLPTLFKLLGWDIEQNYRVAGVKKQQDCDTVLIFDLNENEIIVSNKKLEHDESFTPIGTKTQTIAYPKNWGKSFGENYYINMHNSQMFENVESWNAQVAGVIFPTENTSLEITNIDVLEKEIFSMIGDIKENQNE